ASFFQRDTVAPGAPVSTAADSAAPTQPDFASDLDPGFLYGRVTTVDGAAYEGRLRFGDNEEAYWGDYFNGAKAENPWATQVDRLPTESKPISIFGVEIL